MTDAEVISVDYPRAGAIVGGLHVRRDVPHTASISASLTDYEELPGVRVVSMGGWNADPYKTFYDRRDIERAKNLAEQISRSGEISPLIVVVRGDGEPYILEGVHRLVALHLLGVAEFPAVVVVDTEVEPAVSGAARSNPPEWARQPGQPLTLFHGTPSTNLESIEARGLVPGRSGPWHWRREYERIVRDEERIFGVELLAHVPRFVVQDVWLNRVRTTKDLIYFGTNAKISIRNGLAGLEAEWALRDNLRGLAGSLRWGYSAEDWQREKWRTIPALRSGVPPHWTVQDEILWRREGHLALTVWDVPIHILGMSVAKHQLEIYRRRVAEGRRGDGRFGAEVKTTKAIPPKYFMFTVHLDQPKGRNVEFDNWRDWITGITPGPGFVEGHPALSLDPEVVGA